VPDVIADALAAGVTVDSAGHADFTWEADGDAVEAAGQADGSEASEELPHPNAVSANTPAPSFHGVVMLMHTRARR
jgi:hypothetical protein